MSDRVIVAGLHITGLRQLKKSGVITLHPYSGMTGELKWAVDLDTLSRMTLGERFSISARVDLFSIVDASQLDPETTYRPRFE